MITFSLVHARSVFSCCASVLAIFEVNISQGSAATCFGCDEIFDDCFIANLPESVPVKELWKSAENWLSYRYELGVPLWCRGIPVVQRCSLGYSPIQPIGICLGRTEAHCHWYPPRWPRLSRSRSSSCCCRRRYCSCCWLLWRWVDDVATSHSRVGQSWTLLSLLHTRRNYYINTSTTTTTTFTELNFPAKYQQLCCIQNQFPAIAEYTFWQLRQR